MIKGSSKYEKLAESLAGYYTIATLAERLNIDRLKAIYVIHRLRKLGFVNTKFVAGKMRMYLIHLGNKQRGISYTEKMNEAVSNPAIGVMPFNSYYVHGRVPSYEEVLIYAIKRREVRYIIASLALFKKISDWSLLYKLAKQENLVREVVALYEIARMVVKKVRRMPRRFLNQAQKIKPNHFNYIIQGFSSDDFKEIEKKWKVYIPLNTSDLAEFRYRR